MNKLISIEGIDGCGKSSLTKALADLGYTVYHEIPKQIDGNMSVEDIQNSPNALGIAIRNFLQSGQEDNVKTRNFIALMFTKLRRNYQPELLGLLEKSDVALDRGILSTIVYGYTSEEENQKALEKANFETKIPDVTIYLKIDVQTSLDRLSLRDDNAETYKKMESITKNLFLYEKLIKEHRKTLNIVEIDAVKSEDEVLEAVLKVLDFVK